MILGKKVRLEAHRIRGTSTVEICYRPITSEVIGIDVGVKELAVCSNGIIVKNINKSEVVKS